MDKCPEKAKYEEERSKKDKGNKRNKDKDQQDPLAQFTECYYCGQKGHTYYQCPEREKILVVDEQKRSVESHAVCKNCGGFGHLTSACEQPRHKVFCRKCGEEGHRAQACKKPAESQPEMVLCYRCGEFGHMSGDCKQPQVRFDSRCLLCGEYGHKTENCPLDMPTEKQQKPKQEHAAEKRAEHAKTTEAKPQEKEKQQQKPKQPAPADLKNDEEFPSL